MRKVSFTKQRKMVQMNGEGYSQSAIARELHLDQSTCSKHLNRFKAMAEQMGIEAALAQYQVSGDPDEDRTVIEEFREADLSIGDVRRALRTYDFLEQCGVGHGDLSYLIIGMNKVEKEGYLETLARLNKLELKTGKTALEIVLELERDSEELKNVKSSLSLEQKKLSTLKADAANREQKATKATQEFEQKMSSLKMNMFRLQYVEALALALMETKVEDQDLAGYLESQKMLNEANFGIKQFTEIVGEVKVLTAPDGGAKLLAMLKKYDGLVAANDYLEAKQASLTVSVGVLDKKQAQRAALDGEIHERMQALDKIGTIISIRTSQAEELKVQLEYYKTEIAALTSQKQQETGKLDKVQAARADAEGELQEIKSHIGELGPMKAEYEELNKKLVALNRQVKDKGVEWRVFEGVIGFIQAGSKDELQKNARILPLLLEDVKYREYSIDFLKDYILSELAGPGLRIMRCVTCGTRLATGLPQPPDGYHCPGEHIGGNFHHVVVEKDSAAVLTGALAGQKGQVIFTNMVKRISGPKSSDG
jgi:hypothetical protein